MLKRNILYFLIVFCLFSLFSLPNLFNSRHGLVFITEEIIGSTLFLFGLLLFSPLIRKLVEYLNKKYPWSDLIVKRLIINLGIIIGFSTVTFVALFSLASMYFEVNGPPDFFDKKEQILLKLSKENPQQKGLKNFTIKRFSLTHYTGSIFLGCILLFSMIILIEELFLENKNRKLRKVRDQKIEKEIAHSKIRVLQNQLNPHFMFNSLNVLSGLIHEDVENSNKFINNLSDIYRYVIIQSKEVVSTVEKELEFARSYIYLLKIRFENKLIVSFNIDNSKLNWLLPSMTLELLIENAISHNMLDSKNPLSIEIEIFEDILIVRNNYAPRLDFKNSTGIGIKNLNKRLKSLQNREAFFGVVEDKYIARIPLIKPE